MAKTETMRVYYQTVYEWLYETLDEDGDVIDNDYRDKLSEFHFNNITDSLCLVRIVGNEDEGIIDRGYAWAINKQLPKCFDNGSRIPKRFHKELQKHLETIKQ